MQAEFFTYTLKGGHSLQLTPTFRNNQSDIFDWGGSLGALTYHDRRYMLIDAKTGTFLSQRNAKIGGRKFLSGPRLAKITVMPWTDGDLGVTFSDRFLWSLKPHTNTLKNPFNGVTSPRRLTVTVHEKEADAVDWGNEAAELFSDYLEYPCRLVEPNSFHPRTAPEEFGGTKNDPLNFADGFPILIANQASWDVLKATQDDLAEVDIDRFRANIVLHGLNPFEEDTIKTIKIGDAIFELVKPCARCPVPNIDQKTGERHGKVTQALMNNGRRSDDGQNYFGWNALIRKRGSLGDGSFEILERQPSFNPLLNGVTNTFRYTP